MIDNNTPKGFTELDASFPRDQSLLDICIQRRRWSFFLGLGICFGGRLRLHPRCQWQYAHPALISFSRLS